MTFEEMLERDGKLIYTNKGVSMMPLLRADRDVMVIEACRASEVRKYDAVLFVRPGKTKNAYVLHRVLRLNPDGTFWIVGDNCCGGENVRGEQIIGRLKTVLRDGRSTEMTDWRYRCYVYLWCAPYPLRFVILRMKSFVGKGWRFIKRTTGKGG